MCNLMMLLVSIKLIAYKGGTQYIELVASNFMNSGKVMSASVTTNSKIDEFSKYKSTKNDIVFLGDSITAGGAWSEYFPSESCRNRGIGGDRTYHILNRLNAIVEGKPEKIFLLVGINDLIGKVADKEIISNYKKIIDDIKSKTPKTKLYIDSILPLNNGLLKETTISGITNNDIKNMNSQIEELCNQLSVQYIDCYNQFLDKQGNLKKELTNGGLHLNQEGYLVLSKYIEKVVAQ